MGKKKEKKKGKKLNSSGPGSTLSPIGTNGKKKGKETGSHPPSGPERPTGNWHQLL